MFDDHQMPVRKLLEFLAQLQPTDVLVPNEVKNLAILRNGEFIGFVDFLPGNHGIDFLKGDAAIF